MVDITERKQAEEELKLSNKKFQEIFNGVSDAIFIHDLKDLSITDVNDETCKRFGYTREEIKKMSINELSEGELFSTDTSENRESFEKVMNGEVVVKEWLSKNKDGDTFWHEMTVKLVEIEGEKRLLAIARDISERKQSEERTKQQNKIDILRAEIWELAAQPLSENELIQQLVNKIGPFFNLEHASFLRIYPEKKKAIVDIQWRKKNRKSGIGEGFPLLILKRYFGKPYKVISLGNIPSVAKPIITPFCQIALRVPLISTHCVRSNGWHVRLPPVGSTLSAQAI
jgi:PAS domain S-box-containing protein